MVGGHTTTPAEPAERQDMTNRLMNRIKLAEKTADGLAIYDLDIHASELWVVAGPDGHDPYQLDPDSLPEGFRWITDDEWETIKTRKPVAEDAIRELCVLTNRNQAGQHFTEWSQHWEALEREGLITVHRPIHEATEIPYSQEYYSLEITEDGQDLVDANPELHPSEKRKVLGSIDGKLIYEHDGIHDHQQCANCGEWTGAGAWPESTPYQDEHPDEFEDDTWSGRCPVCGSDDTGLPESYFRA